jgi:hypothetical protein
MRRRDFIKAIAGMAAAWPAAARAQAYPARPITMVIPFAAGGAFDVTGRILAARMSEILGQQVIVENTTGAAGIIGVTRVANAAPDGYTFLFGSIGTHAYNQTIYKKPRYNAVTDFAPVALFAEQPMVLNARTDFPAENLAQFIAYVKANSAKLQFGSAGAGTTTHLGCALLNAEIGVNVTHVPYRGGGLATNDLMAGQIELHVPQPGRRGFPDRGQEGQGDCDALAQPFAADAGFGDRARAGLDRLRRRDLERLLSPQRRAARGDQEAQRGDEPGPRHAGDQGQIARHRDHRRRSRAKIAAIPRQVRRRRDREVGGPDQGERAAGGLIARALFAAD